MSDEQKKQLDISILKIISASPKSKNDLSKKLKLKGYSLEMIDEAIARFERQGLLDDKKFARDLLVKWTELKPSGRNKIRFELRKKGIAGSIIEETLEEIDGNAEYKRAEELAEGKWFRFQAMPLEKRKKKVYDFLVRRGFDFNTVREIIEKLERSQKDEC